jgi:hypothetical protein
MRFRTRASKFENGEWVIVEGEVHRNYSKQPTNRMVVKEIGKILQDLRGMIPDFKEYEVEVILD